EDNFGVLVHDPETGATAAIDAPDAEAIAAALDREGWRLTDLLITHRHADHIQGAPSLARRFPQLRIVGPALEAAQIPRLDLPVRDGDVVRVGALEAVALATPGHTIGHVVYWFEREAVLFSGDTLFAMGCGRVFETAPEIMWTSLERLAALPEETKV